MADEKREDNEREAAEELEWVPEGQPGMRDYDEHGGTGLEPRAGDEIVEQPESDREPIREKVNERTSD